MSRSKYRFQLTPPEMPLIFQYGSNCDADRLNSRTRLNGAATETTGAQIHQRCAHGGIMPDKRRTLCHTQNSCYRFYGVLPSSLRPVPTAQRVSLTHGSL